MDAANITAGIAIVAGTTTAILVPWLQGRIASRDAAATWLRAERKAVYVDAVTRALDLKRYVDWTSDEVAVQYDIGRQQGPMLEHSDAITARLQIVGPQPVVDAWAELHAFQEYVRWESTENLPYLASSDDTKKANDLYEGLLVEVRRALDFPTR